MSTRAVYGFKDDRSTHWVYVHHDGYPTGAAEKFQKTLDSKLAWPLPRFESDEFGASFIAANKIGSGSVRLTSGPEAHGDIEYVYTVSQKGEVLWLDAAYPNGENFWSGYLSTFIKDAKKIEETEHT